MSDNTPLDDYIEHLEHELRTGGGATLDELFDLAIAIRDTLQAGNSNEESEQP